jgi:hypothetical protein
MLFLISMLMASISFGSQVDSADILASLIESREKVTPEELELFLSDVKAITKKLLGIKEVDERSAKSSYNKLVLRYHPDKVSKGLQSQAQILFREISEVWQEYKTSLKADVDREQSPKRKKPEEARKPEETKNPKAKDSKEFIKEPWDALSISQRNKNLLTSIANRAGFDKSTSSVKYLESEGIERSIIRQAFLWGASFKCCSIEQVKFAFTSLNEVSDDEVLMVADHQLLRARLGEEQVKVAAQVLKLLKLKPLAREASTLLELFYVRSLMDKKLICYRVFLEALADYIKQTKQSYEIIERRLRSMDIEELNMFVIEIRETAPDNRLVLLIKKWPPC